MKSSKILVLVISIPAFIFSILPSAPNSAQAWPGRQLHSQNPPAGTSPILLTSLHPPAPRAASSSIPI